MNEYTWFHRALIYVVVFFYSSYSRILKHYRELLLDLPWGIWDAAYEFFHTLYEYVLPVLLAIVLVIFSPLILLVVTPVQVVYCLIFRRHEADPKKVKKIFEKLVDCSG